jgi:hypothetical protein
MGFHVEVAEREVVEYLRHPDRGLRKSDLEIIDRFLKDLENQGEAYRNDASRRLGPDSPLFQVSYIFEDSDGTYRQFRFIIDDAASVYGVLRVRFVDEV